MSHYAPHAEAYPVRVNKGDRRRFDSVAGATVFPTRCFCGKCGKPGEMMCRECRQLERDRMAALELANAECERRQSE